MQTATNNPNTFRGHAWDAAVLKDIEFQQDWLIDKLLPPEGRLLVVAPGKTGKSIFVMDMMHAAATGESFLGFNIPRALRIHYLDFEVGPILMRDRLRKQGLIHDLPRGRLFVTCFPDSLDAGLIAVPDIDIFVIDPAISLRYGDENNSAVIRGHLDDLHRKCRDLGAAVIVVHHTRKESRDANVRNRGLQESRGSSAFTDWMDTGIALRTVEEGTSYELTFLTRGSENPPTMVVGRDSTSLTYHLQDGTITMEDAARASEEEWRANNLFARTKVMPKNELVKQLATRTGKSRASCYRWVAEYRPDGA